MKRMIGGAALLVVLGAAAAYLWYRHEQAGPPPQKRGSTTTGDGPTAPTTTRPPPLLRHEPWPTYGYALARTRFAADLAHRPPYRRVWTFRAGNVIELPPVVAYDRLIVLQQKGRVFSVVAKTGRV